MQPSTTLRMNTDFIEKRHSRLITRCIGGSSVSYHFMLPWPPRTFFPSAA
jgi:hypothetical protein